jgi:hypothetical protein
MIHFFLINNLFKFKNENKKKYAGVGLIKNCGN